MKFFQLSGFERGEIKLRSYKAKFGKFFNYEKGEEEEEREREMREERRRAVQNSWWVVVIVYSR